MKRSGVIIFLWLHIAMTIGSPACIGSANFSVLHRGFRRVHRRIDAISEVAVSTNSVSLSSLGGLKKWTK